MCFHVFQEYAISAHDVLQFKSSLYQWNGHFLTEQLNISSQQLNTEDRKKLFFVKYKY